MNPWQHAEEEIAPSALEGEFNERAAWKQALLDDFADWLDELDEPPPMQQQPPADVPGLETLLREFTALRQEVCLQSRAGNRVGAKVEALAEELSAKLNNISTVAAGLKEDVPRARKDGKRQAVEEVLELFEGISRCAEGLQKTSLPIMIRKASREHVARQLSQPMTILRTKTEDILRRLGLEQVVQLGASFDAQVMRVAGTTQTGAPAGTVTEILRQGYRLDGQLIRTADVTIEK